MVCPVTSPLYGSKGAQNSCWFFRLLGFYSLGPRGDFPGAYCGTGHRESPLTVLQTCLPCFHLKSPFLPLSSLISLPLAVLVAHSLIFMCHFVNKGSLDTSQNIVIPPIFPSLIFLSSPSYWFSSLKSIINMNYSFIFFFFITSLPHWSTNFIRTKVFVHFVDFCIRRPLEMPSIYKVLMFLSKCVKWIDE